MPMERGMQGPPWRVALGRWLRLWGASVAHL